MLKTSEFLVAECFLTSCSLFSLSFFFPSFFLLRKMTVGLLNEEEQHSGQPVIQSVSQLIGYTSDFLPSVSKR